MSSQFSNLSSSLTSNSSSSSEIWSKPDFSDSPSLAFAWEFDGELSASFEDGLRLLSEVKSFELKYPSELLEDWQVWSLTQFCSASFLKTRMKRVLHSLRIASVVCDGVLGLTSLAHHPLPLYICSSRSKARDKVQGP